MSSAMKEYGQTLSLERRLEAWKFCIESDELPQTVRSHLNDLYLILLDILEAIK